MIISPQQLKQAQEDFKGQFHSAEEYNSYLKLEMSGNEKAVDDKIKRSMLIEKVLKSDVEEKSAVTPAEVRAFYDKHPAKFEIPESYAFQSISILPPQGATADQKKEGLTRAQEALKQAKAATNYQEFGLLAEKLSEDDFRVNMGDHKAVAKDQLPPQVVKVFLTLKPGQVSDLIQIEQAYTIVRLTAHTPGGKQNFEAVKATLRTDMQKAKYEQLRASLDKRLRAIAKVEIL